jgi:SH3-like domain-containing protein
LVSPGTLRARLETGAICAIALRMPRTALLYARVGPDTKNALTWIAARMGVPVAILVDQILAEWIKANTPERKSE